MNRIGKLAAATALALGAGTLSAGAVQATDFSDRMGNQRERIQEGVENGALTRNEARKLRRQQQDIRETREELADDGGLSNRDQQVLRRKFNQQSDRIHDQRHDDQDRR